jgi:hypothetical protein
MLNCAPGIQVEFGILSFSYQKVDFAVHSPVDSPMHPACWWFRTTTMLSVQWIVNGRHLLVDESKTASLVSPSEKPLGFGAEEEKGEEF